MTRGEHKGDYYYKMLVAIESYALEQSESAVLAEREACAQIVESRKSPDATYSENATLDAAAHAIRSRTPKPKEQG